MSITWPLTLSSLSGTPCCGGITAADGSREAALLLHIIPHHVHTTFKTQQPGNSVAAVKTPNWFNPPQWSRCSFFFCLLCLLLSFSCCLLLLMFLSFFQSLLSGFVFFLQYALLWFLKKTVNVFKFVNGALGIYTKPCLPVLWLHPSIHPFYRLVRTRVAGLLEPIVLWLL